MTGIVLTILGLIHFRKSDYWPNSIWDRATGFPVAL
jgi:hypothetical protein